MAKALPNDVLDATLEEVATGTTITVCSGQPANSGGTVGNTAAVTCRIHTAGGRTDDRTLQLIITER